MCEWKVICIHCTEDLLNWIILNTSLLYKRLQIKSHMIIVLINIEVGYNQRQYWRFVNKLRGFKVPDTDLKMITSVRKCRDTCLRSQYQHHTYWIKGCNVGTFLIYRLVHYSKLEYNLSGLRSTSFAFISHSILSLWGALLCPPQKNGWRGTFGRNCTVITKPS